MGTQRNVNTGGEVLVLKGSKWIKVNQLMTYNYFCQRWIFKQLSYKVIMLKV